MARIETSRPSQHLEASVLSQNIWLGKLGEALKDEEWNAHLAILLLDDLVYFANNVILHCLQLQVQSRIVLEDLFRFCGEVLLGELVTVLEKL